MAPAKRGAATSKNRKPKGAATKDSTGEAPTGAAGGDSAPSTETGKVDRDDRAKKQSPGRPRGRYPLPVWPD